MIDDLLLRVKNRKLVVLLLPVLVALFLGGMIVVKPSFVRIATLKTRKNDLSKKESVFNAIVEQEKKLFGYRERLSKVPDKAKFIEDLNRLAGESGLTVLSMVPEEKKVTAVYLEKIGVKIDAEGNYHQLGEFISRVESLDQFAKIILVDIDKESNIESYGQPEAGVARPNKSGRKNGYNLSMVVGLFYPVKDVF